MKAKLRFHENDEKKEKTIADSSAIFRKDDILVIDGRFYTVDAAQYDIDKKEATYWLGAATDAHPTSPN